RERLGVVEAQDRASFPGRQEIRLTPAVVADDGQSERHCLEEDQAEALVLARRDEQVADGERRQLVRFADLSGQMDALRYAAFGRATPDRRGVRAVADDQQMRVRD